MPDHDDELRIACDTGCNPGERDRYDKALAREAKVNRVAHRLTILRTPGDPGNIPCRKMLFCQTHQLSNLLMTARQIISHLVPRDQLMCTWSQKCQLPIMLCT